jgi:hypothetical protein
MNVSEAKAQWQADAGMLASAGIHLDGAQSYLPDGFAQNFGIAMDAQPALVTTSNAGIPSFLTTMVDPQIIKVLFAPNKMAQVFGEVKKGSWLDQTAMFPMVEQTGEVSSYGDFANNGRAGLNTDFPQRQSYLYQVIVEYGELEMERAGLARISWASELDQAAVTILNKYQNLTYAFGVAGLENYGLLNDPSLSAALTPSTKTAGGVTWFTAGGAPNANANEVYNDIVSLYELLVQQAGGNVEIDMEGPMVLAMSPGVQVALTFTNTFGITVQDMLKKTYPKIRVETAVQYGKLSASNPQGVAAGNLVQLIAENVGGQPTGYCAFNEKLRSHPIIRGLSSFQQKKTQGTWGSIIRQPFAIAQMVGV